MEVDILLTGVTGFVGRYILYELLTRCPEKRLAVIIRSSGKTTAQQRWSQEIQGSTLFAPFSESLQSVRVIDAALEHLESTTHQLAHATTLIHCAANIKHYDPYEALERDNVGNVERILHLAESLHVQHLLLLSTCYVHPRRGTTSVREPVRIGGSGSSSVKRADFYNDYCYTKWLGEETVFAKKSRIPNITIARLSCVGAPSRWELAAHPCAAQAHLGILSLALRGYLETLAWRPNARISTIPVDIVAKALVTEILATPAADETWIRILQICAPPKQTEYHISLPLLVSTLQTEYGLEEFRGLTRSVSRGDHLAWWKHVVYSCVTRGKQALTLHTHIQDFVSTFTDEDIRFVSSLKEDLFPARTEQDVVRDTCAYAVRILHHRQLVKGVPMGRLDQFWHRMANREPVQVCIGLGEGVGIGDWPAFSQRLWTFILSQQKYGAGISNASALNEPLTWKQLSGHSHSTYIASPHFLEGPDCEESILAYGLRQTPPARLWHVTPFFRDAEKTHISYILLRFDHGLVDGVGAVSHLPDFTRHVLESDETTGHDDGIRQTRSLPLWLDLWMGIVYAVLMVLMVWTAPSLGEAGQSKEPTVATATTGFVGPPAGRTFTTDVLWKLTQYFTTTNRETAHIFAVPAVSASFRPIKDMPTNAFVPVLLPVDGGMSEEAFQHRCMFLRARSVRFLSWCLVHLLEWGGWDELRDLFLGKVRCIVSSVQTGSLLSSAISSFHVVTTTPTPIPYSVTVVSSRESVFFTARSHDSRVAASDLLAALTGEQK
jgi:thioester reductase-like protein